MTQEIKLQEPDYSVKITGHKDYVTIDVHHYHFLNKDLSFDIANQITVDAYVDAINRLRKEGFRTAPLVDDS